MCRLARIVNSPIPSAHTSYLAVIVSRSTCASRYVQSPLSVLTYRRATDLNRKLASLLMDLSERVNDEDKATIHEALENVRMVTLTLL